MRQWNNIRTVLSSVRLVFFALFLATATLLTQASTYAQEGSDFLIYLPIVLKNWPISYSIVQVDNDGATEYRFICGGHHFMTLIDSRGEFILRPHPGVDENGWGSSWYAQPFLPRAVLGHTVIETLEAKDGEGIHVVASGSVSRGISDTYGTWSITLDFECIRTAKKIIGAGQYTIQPQGDLTYLTGDLNLYKIASNYLYDVPLLSGGRGNTGDMEKVYYARGDGVVNEWVPTPEPPGHFPIEAADKLSVDVIGQYNNVNTLEMTDEDGNYFDFCIEPAFKPGIRVDLTSQQPDVAMTFGAFYTTTFSQTFSADNVAVTPLIRQPRGQQVFHFDVEFESKALVGDGSHPDSCPD